MRVEEVRAEEAAMRVVCDDVNNYDAYWLNAIGIRYRCVESMRRRAAFA